VRLLPPVPETTEELIRELARSSDGIVAIHPARNVLPLWETVNAAAQPYRGYCPIEVIDCGAFSAGQMMLVTLAARMAAAGASAPTIAQVVRQTAERVFVLLYVDGMETVPDAALFSPSHRVLGTVLGVKPLLGLESGALMAVEKVRTRVQALERIAEYVGEFSALDEVVVLHGRPYATDMTRMVQERLAETLPARTVPVVTYGPALAAVIGPDAIGVVLLESDFDISDESADDEL
jgi:DegV family protein with EDD domain